MFYYELIFLLKNSQKEFQKNKLKVYLQFSKVKRVELTIINENSWLFFIIANQTLEQSFEVKLPQNIVPKSARAYLSLTGDALGPVLNNLDNLVQQPTGCGEQNMVKFAPIVSVTDYLKHTNQLKPQMDELTKQYLKIGYQRQLTYRHKDGSFSAFGPSYSDITGGTWLTAFVLRCFAESFESKHITIDENDILMSYNQLLSRQNQDGSFSQIGAQLFSKALAGGLKDEKVGLSAYVMVSLIKARKALKSNDQDNYRIEIGIEYLKIALENIENVDLYSLTLVLYCLKLAQTDNVIISKIETELDKRAIIQSIFLNFNF